MARIGVTLLSSVVLAVASCSGGDAAARPLDAVLAAARRATAGTSSVVYVLEGEGGPLRYSGEVDHRDGRARLTITLATGASAQVLVSREAVLLHVPAEGWVRLPAFPGDDPVALLGLLATARDAHPAEFARVSGVRARRYVVEGAVPLEAWVDGAGRLRRLRSRHDGATATLELSRFGIPVSAGLPAGAVDALPD